ncbi:MAG: hypothetical protein SFT94_09095 [Pseudanabaenaceae cyanobacterium bins.68]|nr:hypothetical protein [Pseudanabaenaceae cyanobacterium bins.68]
MPGRVTHESQDLVKSNKSPRSLRERREKADTGAMQPQSGIG